jgi:hypothetical protein
MFEEDKEEPATVIITSVSGQGYDIKNIPGFKRKQLIDSGDITVESFVQADNMPGAKLKKMRDAFKSNNNIVPDDKSTPLIDINTLEIGGLVSYRKFVTEIRKINIEKGLVNINYNGKVVWVNVAKLKSVNIPPDDEE